MRNICPSPHEVMGQWEGRMFRLLIFVPLLCPFSALAQVCGNAVLVQFLCGCSGLMVGSYRSDENGQGKYKNSLDGWFCDTEGFCGVPATQPCLGGGGGFGKNKTSAGNRKHGPHAAAQLKETSSIDLQNVRSAGSRARSSTALFPTCSAGSTKNSSAGTSQSRGEKILSFRWKQ